MSLSLKTIQPLLQSGAGVMSRWFSFIGLGLGVLLLFCAIQLFINMQHLLKGKTIKKNDSDYIAVTKKVTNENMGSNEKVLFTEADVRELKSKKIVEDVAPLVSTDFQVEINGPDFIPFQTELFLEAIRPDFIDTLPPGFDWHEGQTFLPVIISSEFLEVFNVFAPNYGYSKVSPETLAGIPVMITCTGKGIKQTFTGKIIGFTDRISSALVPIPFIEWANNKFGSERLPAYSRLFIKTRDANDPELLNFLDQKNYTVNKDKTRFGRVKQVLQIIFSGLAAFGLLIVILSIMLYSFYLQLVIAKNKENLQLLLALGYSPKWLSQKISQKQFPIYAAIILTALVFTQLLQWSFSHFVLSDMVSISPLLSWVVFFVALFLILLSSFINYRMLKNLILQIQ